MRKLSMEALNRKSIEEFRISEKIPVIAVLENIRSAYNVGSVFRTADAFLLEAVYITGYTARPPHKEIAKTALGAQESVDWRYFPTTQQAIEELRERNYQVWAVEQASGSLKLEDFKDYGSRPAAFIFGNEVSGVEESTISLSDDCIEIPQFGMKHSLNISVAAGIVLWEAAKTLALKPI